MATDSQTGEVGGGLSARETSQKTRPKNGGMDFAGRLEAAECNAFLSLITLFRRNVAEGVVCGSTLHNIQRPYVINQISRE